MTTPTVEIESPPVVIPVATPPAPETDDPFRYGWRWVPNDPIDGWHKLRQIPLTLEDVLHPEEGDEIMHSDAHERNRTYLYDVLLARTANRPDAVVLTDVRIAWDVPGLKAHGLDLMLIFGVGERKNWTTFDVAEEGVRPTLIIEVVSPEYAGLDRSTKLEHYDRAGVPFYLILDTLQQDGHETLRLLAYHRPAGKYTPLPTDERERVWLEPVQIWVSVEHNELVIYDEHNVVIPNFVGMVQARDAAEQRAAAEAEQRRVAEQRAAAEAEQRRVAEQRAAAEAEQRRIAEQRAADFEAQLQALQAEIARLRNG
jgi:Uma2 family endonuclease